MVMTKRGALKVYGEVAGVELILAQQGKSLVLRILKSLKESELRSSLDI